MDRNHKSENQAYDADIITVRFPYVYEEIGERKDNWHDKLKDMIPNFKKNIIGVIYEVKSGKNGYSVSDLFKGIKQKQCLQRFGFY
ncbi:hypothetical protein ACAG39_08270 [Caldicellulosiruptoraceae bacterium PP1]